MGWEGEVLQIAWVMPRHAYTHTRIHARTQIRTHTHTHTHSLTHAQTHTHLTRLALAVAACWIPYRRACRQPLRALPTPTTSSLMFRPSLGESSVHKHTHTRVCVLFARNLSPSGVMQIRTHAPVPSSTSTRAHAHTRLHARAHTHTRCACARARLYVCVCEPITAITHG